MGHISPAAVTGLDLDMSSKPSFCEACAKVKPTHNPVPKEHDDTHTATVDEKVLSDVWEPSTPQSYDGKDYFISSTDDHSCRSCVEPMDYKSKSLLQYQSYEAWLKMQHGRNIRHLQTVHSGEYLRSFQYSPENPRNSMELNST